MRGGSQRSSRCRCWSSLAAMKMCHSARSAVHPLVNHMVDAATAWFSSRLTHFYTLFGPSRGVLGFHHHLFTVHFLQMPLVSTQKSVGSLVSVSRPGPQYDASHPSKAPYHMIFRQFHATLDSPTWRGFEAKSWCKTSTFPRLSRRIEFPLGIRMSKWVA